MNFFEQLEQSHYGSIELKRVVGPNLLKGLAASVLLHFVVISIPLLLGWLQREPPKAPETTRMVTAQLTRIVPLPETPKPVPIRPGRSGKRGSGGQPGNGGARAQFWAEFESTLLEPVDGPSILEPRSSLIDPLLSSPTPDLPNTSYLPVAANLPDVSSSPVSGAYDPLAGLPAPQSRAGGVYGAKGTQSLPDVGLTPYSGPNVGPPGSHGTGGSGDGLGYGGRGSGSGRGGSGGGDGSGYGNGPGDGPGMGTYGSGPGSGTSGTGPGGDGQYVSRADDNRSVAPAVKIAEKPVVSTNELSGLIAWMKQQSARFPAIVQSFMETRPGDLCGVTRYGGWDIFIQFSPDEHQLKIFLSRGSTGILLADSDFRQRSQLFAQGTVNRGATDTITAIEAIRDKPSDIRTDEFYRVFGDWMAAQGISMGSRAAR